MAKEGHPKGLYLLFVTEMAERFSYYGMRAVFTLYMVAALFTMESASEIYGYYTGLVYLTPLLGGYIADRYWGNRRSIIVGGILMAFGQFLMFLSASFVQPAIKEAEGMIDPTVNNQLAIICMMGGLFFSSWATDSSSPTFRPWWEACTALMTNGRTQLSQSSTWASTWVPHWDP